uniref:Uncharacterized protein n=1 Tax=Meloidogyne floridensis TaxID=298350 RepID=A0A915NTF2_9BILA
MACNPCCCLSLKDAVVTIGIWSTIYALAQLAIFGWQFSVLTQCQHVVMAQSNLQCEYYCPCVGASTARTSAIIEDFVDSDKRTDLPQVQQGQRRFGGIQRPPASQFPAVSPPGQPPLRHKSIPPPHTIPVPPLPSTEQIIPQQLPKQPFYKQKTPMERFVQEASAPPPQYRESFSPPFDVPRSRSAIDRPFNRHADEFYRETPNRFRRANSSHRYRPTCRNCGREHGRRYNYRYQCRRCYPDISTRMRHRKNSSSSLCSLATHHEITDNLDDNRSDRNLTQNRLRHRPPMPLPPQTHWSGFVPPMSNSEHNYTNLNSKERTQSLAPPILPRRRKRNESAMEGISSQTRPSQKTLEVPQGISIPQHIIIPPMTNDGTLDSQTERQYRINSEIVISYDQPSRQNISSQTFQSPPSGKQLKNTEISNQQKLPIPLERRSLKSSISPKQVNN